VPVQHREAQVLAVAEVVEECPLGDLRGGEDLFQLRVVIPLEREQTGRRPEDLLPRFQRSRLRDGFHRPISRKQTGWFVTLGGDAFPVKPSGRVRRRAGVSAPRDKC
jgi:hypothetical protein